MSLSAYFFRTKHATIEALRHGLKAKVARYNYWVNVGDTGKASEIKEEILSQCLTDDLDADMVFSCCD